MIALHLKQMLVFLLIMNSIFVVVIQKVHKELQDAMQQLEAIRHEIRSVSVMYPGPMTRKLMDFPPQPAVDLDGSFWTQKCLIWGL